MRAMMLIALHDAKLPDAPTKVSAILLRLAGHQTLEIASRKIEITQAELADIAGLSRNVINRALRDLSKKRLVSVGYRFIEVSDPGSLSKRLAFASGSKRSIW
jgi:CRP-like cAMP-binding protein